MYPAKDFEEFTGFTGISYTYNMPHDEEPYSLEQAIVAHVDSNNWSCYTIEGTASDNLSARMRRAVKSTLEKDSLRSTLQEHAQDILNLNPVLQTIRFSFNRIPDLYDFILGATSGFHPADIQHYLDLRDDKNSLGFSKEQHAIHTRIQNLWPEEFRQFSPWKMSPHTIERITTQLDAYEAKQSSKIHLEDNGAEPPFAPA
ncbi:MAG: hypothetical protein GC137_08540 [Alphaproteobacteria bacterium]|nr:hypothetical protein [Alphaproteobacteria bacterium]